jgi:hypothetical protein
MANSTQTIDSNIASDIAVTVVVYESGYPNLCIMLNHIISSTIEIGQYPFSK